MSTTHTSAAQETRTVEVAVVTTGGEVSLQAWERQGDSGSLLCPLQQAVGGLIDVTELSEDLTMYVHDEGIYRCEPNPVATLMGLACGRSQPYFGDVVFLGGVDENGEDTSLGADAREAIAKAANLLAVMPDLADALREGARRWADPLT